MVIAVISLVLGSNCVPSSNLALHEIQVFVFSQYNMFAKK